MRHTPDATFPDDAATDAAIDAPLAPAMLSGSPGATAFGDVVLGQTTAKVTYTISNDGEQTSGTLGVLLDSTTAGFTISENLCSGVALAPHETCTFKVSFQPSVAGLAMTTVRAGTSPGGEVARDLTGTGLQPGAIDITEASHDYAKLAVDAAQPGTHTFTVKNNGQVAIGVPMPEITGTIDSYSIASTTCTAMLAPLATCAVVVHFDPPTVGMKPGSLVVTASPGGADSATLAGTGFAHVAVTKSGTGGTVTSNVTGIDCGSSCAADFTTTPVSLTAVPATGSMFAGWTGDCSGMVGCSLDLTAGKAVTAAFAPQRFVLTTMTAGNGSGTVTGAGTYDYNTPVTVTATPATGSTFTGFTGACIGMGPCTVMMTQARSVTAGFDLVPETLTVTSGAGGTITSNPAGISCAGTTCSKDFDYNTPVTLTATPDVGQQLAVWAGACSGVPATSPTCTVTMTQARAVTATFSAIPETLTVTSGSGGKVVSTPAGISCTSAGGAGCTHAFAYGTPVTLTASPATGSTFTGFTGACTSMGPCTVTMTQARSVTAGFDLIPETLTVTSGTGGTITSSPAGISCAGTTCSKDFDYNTPVTLTATPDVGQQLAVWAGACSGVPVTSPTCTVTMDQAQSVTVRFAPQPFTLTTTTTGSGQGTVTGAGTYPYNTPVTVTATPATGSTFASWSGDCIGQGPCVVTMTQARSVTAAFTADPETLTVTNIRPGGTVTSNPAGISCAGGNVGTCTKDYGYGAPVTLKATPDVGVKLGSWGGACANVPATTPTCTVTMDQAQSVSVTWQSLQYKLNLSFLGDSTGTVTVNGIAYAANTTITVNYGQSTLTASPTAGNGSMFWAWGGACSGNATTCTINVTGDTNVSAEFDQSNYRWFGRVITQNPQFLFYGVTISTGSASGECQSASSPGTACGSSLPRGTVVTLTAHFAAITSGAQVWNDLPSWTGCDTVSADHLTCTATVLSTQGPTVSGDARVGP